MGWNALIARLCDLMVPQIYLSCEILLNFAGYCAWKLLIWIKRLRNKAVSYSWKTFPRTKRIINILFVNISVFYKLIPLLMIPSISRIFAK